MAKKSAVVIPARYASSRFPGKPLAMLAGKPMICHVCEKASASKADYVIVATDDERIAAVVKEYGYTAMMTRSDHQSGTDRIAEVVKNSDPEIDIIINVQGDEPLIPTSAINDLLELMSENADYDMATIAVPADRDNMTENNVKVVFGSDGKALYFSRSMIPFARKGGVPDQVYLHWGIYAYRRTALEKFVALPAGRLEKSEMLEQLRALENGISIYVLIKELESIGVDTPEDLEKAELRIAEMNK